VRFYVDFDDFIMQVFFWEQTKNIAQFLGRHLMLELTRALVKVECDQL
jgi:hypothetical protein